MDHETLDVIHVEFMDKREADMKSPVMETRAFVKGLKEIKDKGLQVTEIITDAHASIRKHMSMLTILNFVYDGNIGIISSPHLDVMHLLSWN